MAAAAAAAAAAADNKAVLKHCSVVGCTTNSELNANLFFLKVPNLMERRLKWCKAMGVAPTAITLHCCTKHFDVPNDFEGLTGKQSSKLRLKLRLDVVPHKKIPLTTTTENLWELMAEVAVQKTLTATHPSLIPMLRDDLDLIIPDGCRADALQSVLDETVATILAFFQKHALPARHELLQVLLDRKNEFHDKLYAGVKRRVVERTDAAQVSFRTIQPFLIYDSSGCIELDLDRKKYENVQFELDYEQNCLKAIELRRSGDPVQERISLKTMNELLSLPEVQVTLNLPFLSITRSLQINHTRYLVMTDSILKPEEVEPNRLETFEKLQKTNRNKKLPLAQSTTLEYMDVLINMFLTNNFSLGPMQKSMIVGLLTALKADLESGEMKEQRCTMGYYMNKQKYYRILNEDAQPDLDSLDRYLYIKEVVNPEVNFTIQQAPEDDDNFLQQVTDYIQPIIRHLEGGEAGAEGGEDSDAAAYCKFQDALRNAIVITCEDCALTFDSKHAYEKVVEHLYWYNKSMTWKCTLCNLEYPLSDLISRGWAHTCQ